MTVRRAILGKYNDGTFGLRCSLPGADAADDSDDQMSFNSNWTDIAKIHQVGVASSSFSKIPFPNLGYKPFMEVRRLDGATVYDDYISAAASGFNSMSISTDGFVAYTSIGMFSLVYLIWRIQAPVQ